LDKVINDQYKDKESLSKIVGYFALTAIFLSCLGLFSLASFLAVQRSREIAIRKVLVASIRNILTLLSKDFVMSIILAFVIGKPASYFIMHRWVQNFAYRLDIKWWIFPVAGMSVMLLTILTVSLQSIKTAMAKPAEKMKVE